MSQKSVLTSETLETPQDHSQAYKSFFRPEVSRSVYRRELFSRNKVTLSHLSSKCPDESTSFSQYFFDSKSEIT